MSAAEKIDPTLIMRWEEKGESGKTVGEETIALIEACVSQNETIVAKLQDLRGINLENQNLKSVNFSRCDLSGANLTNCELTNSNLSYCKLVGASLQNATLDSTELLGADLTGAQLAECQAIRVGFGGAKLHHANFFGANCTGSTFSKSELDSCDFRAANLTDSRIRESNLEGTDFSRAVLRNVDFRESKIAKCSFDGADLREAQLRGIRGYEDASWYGADIREVDFVGSYLVRRHIMDENYLFEYRNRGRFFQAIYMVWWLTSDCGRSLFRWVAFTTILIILFAVIYTVVEVDYGNRDTLIAPLYFSVVTLTTLGYGDIVPASAAAQLVVVVEALTGYLALGGALSILSNKLARRAD